MTPEYILRASLCRAPLCAGPDELGETPLADWPQEAHQAWQTQARHYIDNLDWAEAYAIGQGLDQPRKGILFSNWNLFPRGVCDILKKYGYSCDWEDQFAKCDGCYKALQTAPDSYSWQPSYISTDDGYLCLECLTTDDIDNAYQNQPDRAVNSNGIDLTKHGYVEIQCGFESGWYPGQNDNPREIYDSLKDRYQGIVFQISGVGQFDIGFCVWHKTCADCGGKQYRDATRSDGRCAVERCDTCNEDMSDEDCVKLALKEGIVAVADYPAFVICRHPGV